MTDLDCPGCAGHPAPHTCSRPRKRAAPPKPAILVAPPADERDAWRLIADAIATEIVSPAELADALRPVLARLARGAQREQEADCGYCYAGALRDAARTLERADARRTWAWARAFRRRHGHHVDAVALTTTMRNAWRQFHGARSRGL